MIYLRCNYCSEKFERMHDYNGCFILLNGLLKEWIATTGVMNQLNTFEWLVVDVGFKEALYPLKKLDYYK